MFDIMSVEDASEHCLYPELDVESLRLRLSFIFAPNHVTEVIVLGERIFSVAVHKFDWLGTPVKRDNVALRQTIDHPPSQVSVHCFFPCDPAPNLLNETFAIINQQPTNMQSELWIIVAEFRHELVCAGYLGRRNCTLQKAAQVVDSGSTAVFSECVWVLHDFFSFSALHVLSRRKN